MAFDPDAYLKKNNVNTSPQGFDPDAYLNKVSKPETQDRTWEAALEGFGSGASFGYTPQLQAITEKFITNPIQNLLKSDEEKRIDKEFNVDTGVDYTKARDSYIQRAKDLQEENPWAYGAGNVAGAIASSAIPGAAAGKVAQSGRLASVASKLPLKYLDTASKVLSKNTLGASLGKAAVSGAGVGLIRNPGDIEGEFSPFQIEERLSNAGTDALTGAAVVGGLRGAGKAIESTKNIGKTLMSYSQDKALKSSGAMLKDFRKAFGNKKVAGLGQAAIDEGIVNVGDDINAIAKNADSVKAKVGQEINNIYQQADDYITSAPQGVFNINVNKVVSDFETDLASRYQGKAGAKQIISKVTDVLDDIKGNGNVTMSEAQKIRASIDDLIDYSKANNELKPVQQELMGLRNKIQDSLKDNLKNIDAQFGSDLSDQFTKQNARYSKVAELSKMANDKVARETSNAAFGMRERLAGGAGAVVGGGIGATIGGPVGAAVGAAVGSGVNSITTKVARQYGTPFVAITANKIAKSLSKNPLSLGKYSKKLLELSNSPKEFVTAVNGFMKEPDFKRQLDGLNNIRPRIASNERE